MSGRLGLRLHVGPLTAQPGEALDLLPGPVRHLQVRRAQPGDVVQVFDGLGREWSATVLAMGRQSAQLRLDAPLPVAPELPWAITLAVGMPANERMDVLVEKAGELGVAAIQPLVTERAVLRLSGERARKRQAHWQAIAASASEQCGRATVAVIHPVLAFDDWLRPSGTAGTAGEADAVRWLLSPRGGLPVPRAHALAGTARRVSVLSGPEGGLSAAEEAAARAAGFQDVQLGPRVLRADTAPLAVLAWLALQA